jgi:hypothetical protein
VSEKSPVTKYTGSFTGIGRILKSPAIADVLMSKAQEIMAEAVRSAPDDVEIGDVHSGRYKKSFKIRRGFKPGGGRVMISVYNDAPEALYVEKGTVNNEAKHILLRALQIVRK